MSDLQNLSAVSLMGLFLLFATSQFCDHVLGILDDNFYRPFHFAGGLLTTLFLYGVLQNSVLAFLGVIIIGILWEIFEWAQWRFIPVFHKPSRKPRGKDTRNDLLDDALGALSAIITLNVFGL